jgi:hypothetical protein
VYCDLSRLEDKGQNWQNPGRTEEMTVPAKDYEDCKSGKTLAFTAPLEGVRQAMYLCQMDEVGSSIQDNEEYRH